MATALPDYYSQLGVSASASPEEVRKAYRSLALRFHPDKAPQNPFAEAQFLRLKEAYEVLKDPVRRQRYDRERWLRGTPVAPRRQAVTAEGLVKDAHRLEAHIAHIGPSAINAAALQSLCLFLLSEAHLALFWERADPALNETFVKSLLRSVAYLPPAQLRSVLAQLQKIKPLSPALQEELSRWMHTHTQALRLRRLAPLWVLLLTLLLCLTGWIIMKG